ncbi:hypothetical protein VTJ04DRAFT_4562 [Mycothermus thermophilus]|uniref:uncharacterized protein n=1 Tax=Humicola insolens TaxID=85995 RepID=UPI003742A0BA
MFPVKGFNVPVDKLKDETGAIAAPAPAAASSTPKPSRKRKRPAQENVTADNLAALWEKVIEHKEQPKHDNKRPKKDNEGSNESGSKPDKLEEKRKKKKKQKKDKREKHEPNPNADTKDAAEDGDEWSGIDDEEAASKSPAATKEGDKSNKKKNKSKNANKDSAGNQHSSSDNKPTSSAPAPAPTSAPSQPKLTPLQASMREKLISARFRHLNETLYTRPSTEAFQLFQESPDMFNEYHEGFRRQVQVWPENPVDTYIAEIKARAKVRFPPKNNSSHTTTAPNQLPLPRLHPSKLCTIADLGCGDAKLASALQPLTRKLHLEIRSFDLQTGGSPLVTRADIADLPLPDGSVDVAIFCLALMGTNWLSFIEEAYRVLRWRGELWVAEIKSRFAGRKGTNKTVSHSVGNKRKPGAATPMPGGKKNKKPGHDDEDEINASDIEAAEPENQLPPNLQQNQETDISAFVEALRKRGFLLHRDLGDAAVDMSNKMFVRMHFVKAAQPTKGKCVQLLLEEQAKKEGQQQQQGGGKGKDKKEKEKKQKLKFIEDGNAEAEDEEEKGILKPCVYKVR